MTMIQFKKKEIIQWIAPLSVIVILYVTGLHTEVLGGIQRLVLATGISKPEIPSSTALPVLVVNKEQNNYKYDVRLTNLQGEEFNLSSLKGKVVFMNLWASWCPPCIAEMPNIQALYNKMDKSKVAFVMLSLDENQQKAKKFIARKKHTFPVYFPSNGLPQDLYSSAIPTTFILGPDGSILAKHEGMADYDTEEFRNYLSSLVKK